MSIISSSHISPYKGDMAFLCYAENLMLIIKFSAYFLKGCQRDMIEYKVSEHDAFLRCRDFPGNDIPILFIHELGRAGSFDYPQVAAQCGMCEHRRILVDLLGTGYSDKPNNSDTAFIHTQFI